MATRGDPFGGPRFISEVSMKYWFFGLIVGIFTISQGFAADEPVLEHLYVCTAAENAVKVNVDLQRKGDEYFAQYDVFENGDLLGSYLAQEIRVAEQVGATSYVTKNVSKKAADGSYQNMNDSQFWFSYFDRDVFAGSVLINLVLEGRKIELVTKNCRS